MSPERAKPDILTLDTKFRFVPAAEYPTSLLDAVQKAQKRIVLQDMAVAYDQTTEPIFEAMIQAARRGVDVTLLVDDFSNYFVDNQFRFSIRSSNRRKVNTSVGNLKKYMDSLKQAGGKACVIHPYKYDGESRTTNPYGGRNHAKVTIVDDRVWTFGGVNFSQGAFGNYDHMLDFEDRRVADFFSENANRLAQTKKDPDAVYDRIFPVDLYNTILFDIGKPGTSVIYDYACDEAEKADGGVLLVSQAHPGRKLEKILARKQKELGTDAVTVVTNHFGRFPFPANVEQLMTTLRSGLHIDQLARGFVHAKFVIFTYKSGDKILITGSHNFNTRFVRFGTVEIALLTRQPDIIAEFEEYASSLPVV